MRLLSRTTPIDAGTAADRLGDGSVVVVDVRQQAEWKTGHIRGAIHIPLAHQALQAEPELGVLLPCNVVVYERDGSTHVSAVDAERMLSIVGNDELLEIAADVKRRLAAVVERATTA